MKLIFGALLLSIAAHANATFVSGNDLLSNMDDSKPTRMLYAQGYVAGVVDLDASSVFCPAPGLSLGEMLDVTKRYLQAHRESGQLSASLLVLRALREVWPCPTQ
jgi:hypothetical protein